MSSIKIMIVTSSGFPEEKVKELRHKYNDRAEFVMAKDNKDDILGLINGVNGIIGCPSHIFSPEIIEAAGQDLTWIHHGGAGVESHIFPEFIKSSIQFTNGKILQGPEVADHALALLLSLTRNVQALSKGVDKQDIPRAIELYNKKAVIFGVGGIGMLIAERAKAFGMKVVGIDDDYHPMLSMFEKIVKPYDKNDEIPDADVVICAAPYTKASKSMFGKYEFMAMKKNAYFVNISRGGLVDTQGLTEALESGHLAGVGLDVTDPEPLPENHALRHMDRVIITPHIAGHSDANRERSWTLIEENIGHFIHGRPLLNIVNKELGY